jgi:hypothetical protein
MATYYVQYRKNGPVGVYSVIANNREAAIQLVKNSGVTGEEFAIYETNTYGFAATAATGPTGATGATGGP